MPDKLSLIAPSGTCQLAAAHFLTDRFVGGSHHKAVDLKKCVGRTLLSAAFDCVFDTQNEFELLLAKH